MLKNKLALGLIAFAGMAAPFGLVAGAEQDVNARIIDGTLRPVSEYPMVAQLFIGDGACTGTLISSRHVLTAGHCFFDENGNRVSNVGVMSAILNGAEFGVSQVTVHPTYVPRNSACNSNEVDAAVMELSSEVSGISPIPLIRSAPQVGATVLLAGFGVQGSGSSGENGSFPATGYINVGYTQIEEVADNLYVNWYFDSGAGESNTAGGDSGGPAFIDVSGVRYIHSITCGGTGNAGWDTSSTNTRADAIASWVDAVTGGGGGGGGTLPVTEGTITLKKVRVDFGDNDNYTFYARGTIDLGAGFNPRGKTVTINVGGHSESFVLSRAGYAYRRRGDDYVELSGRLSRGAFTKSQVKIDIGLVDSEALYEALLALFPEDPSALGEEYRYELPITIDIDGVQFNATVPLKAQRMGERWVK